MARSPLDRIEIASPCSADWDGMKGDDKARHCGQCDLDVYDLSAMGRAEAEALIAAREGRLCLRLYRRPDGRVITRDCPEGRALIGQRRSVLMAGLAGAASLALGAGAGLLASTRRLPIAVVEMGDVEVVPAMGVANPCDELPPEDVDQPDFVMGAMVVEVPDDLAVEMGGMMAPPSGE